VQVFFSEDPAQVHVKWARGRFPATVERRLQELVGEHREALWIEWSTKVAPNEG
jgi:hypothetical protein